MHRNDIFDKIIGLSKIKRTGLVNRGIMNPENVMEHSFKCVWIAISYLPENLNGLLVGDDAVGYCYTDIILLLFVHDFGETDIGDIVRGKKTDNMRSEERGSIHKLLHDGLRDKACLAERLIMLWDDMESGCPKNINAKIAKDIDIIQGAHQYFSYVVSGGANDSFEACIEWIEEISDKKIRTILGRHIRNEVIYGNNIFLENTSIRRAMNFFNINGNKV